MPKWKTVFTVGFISMLSILLLAVTINYFGWFSDDTTVAGGATSHSVDVACPVRTCIFVDSTKWSVRVPTGKRLSWLRSDSPDTVLEMRPDGDDDRIKVWRNHTDVSFKKSAFVQVRLKKGSGAMVYFDNPTRIAALESGR